MFNGARILVAPLDWGLGHAARCVPIIRRLIGAGAVPVIGAAKGPLALLRRELPALEHVEFPGLPINYSTGDDQTGALMRRFPSMLGSIRSEFLFTQKLLREMALNAIISDQRFGVRSRSMPSILITHQLFPKAPLATSILHRVNHHLIGKFDRCWIMDHTVAPGLAGELSHGDRLPGNCRYIGPQSRFDQLVGSTGEKYRTMTILSGPEPQRSILERLLLAQLLQVEGDHLLVQGKPDASIEKEQSNITIVPHLESDRLMEKIGISGMIIARSGYTTIMDLIALGKNALLIPTPGQPEQEYLAVLHSRSSRFIVQAQDRIDLQAALQQEKRLSPGSAHFDHEPLDAALLDLANILEKR